MTPSGSTPASPIGSVVERSRLSLPEAGAVRELAARAAAADSVAPLSEQALLHLDDVSDDPDSAGAVSHLLVTGPGGVSGYAQLDRGSAELVVDPPMRRRGVGTALLEAAVQAAGGTQLQVWAHGDTEAARAFAARAGWPRARVLLQMRRSLTEALPAAVWPDDVRVRSFVVGADEQAWLEVNNAAFASHPEQGGWTLHDVQQREHAAWFDPAGVFLAERAGELVGFHWTKVHDDVDPPIGEVYIVGVRPQEAGRGLGRALTLAGLDHLRGRGLDSVLLYVDEDNVPAVKTYERLGFTRYATDVQYVRAAS